MKKKNPSRKKKNSTHRIRVLLEFADLGKSSDDPRVTHNRRRGLAGQLCLFLSVCVKKKKRVRDFFFLNEFRRKNLDLEKKN